MPLSQPPLFTKDNIYRPQDYGSIDPTGTNDSSTAIQAALTACSGSLYGGTVEIPPGRFKIGTGLSFASATYDSAHGWGYRFGRRLVGASRGATTLEAASGLTSPVLSIAGNSSTGVPAVELANIGFNGNAQSGLADGVVKMSNVAFAEFRNVQIMGATGGSTLAPIGLNVVDSLTTVFDHVVGLNADTIFKFSASGSGLSPCNQIVLRNCVAAGSTAWGVDISSGDNVMIDGIDVEGGSGGCIRYSAGGKFFVTGNVWLEGLGYSSGAFDITASDAVISGPNLQLGGVSNIQNRGTTKLVVRDCTIGGTCTNAAGATLKKANATVTGSGGTTTTLY